MELEFSVDAIPPSVNGYWKVRRFGGRYITPEGVAFKKLVLEAVRTIDVDVRRYAKYRLRIVLTSSNWFTKKGTIKQIDLDNFAKCCCDALFEALEIDDSQVFELRMSKVVGESNQTTFWLGEI